MPEPEPGRIAFVGSYVPRCCGIATYTRDLRAAVAAHLPRTECLVVSMNDAGSRHDYPAEVRFECGDDALADYRRAAEFLNLRNVDVVSLQHEYGIFGGDAGEHVLALLGELRVPIHTTLHTVLAEPSAAQRRVMREVIHLSARLAVMTQRGRSLLRDVYGVSEDRIDVIPHGIPDMPFTASGTHKVKFGLGAATVLLTFGLLSPNKGIETVIAALPHVVAHHPDVVYVVLGATHPHLLRDRGEDYRVRLERLAGELGVRSHVVFHNRFVELPELLDFIGAADVYVTPYLNEDQITSGTLAYAFGCGKAVLSTPYWHARELLAEGRGILVPFRDAAAIGREIRSLLTAPQRRASMSEQAWRLGREMTWARTAVRYAESFRMARRAAIVKPRQRATGPGRPPRQPLPPLVLDHLWQLTDSTGLLQHATHDVPNFAEGYCADDNARALTLMVRIADLGRESPRSRRATSTYAAFLGHARDRTSGRFRNFLGFDRHWLDDRGSDDCLGRVVLALGSCIGRSRRPGLQRWAADLFTPALEAVVATTSPRAWSLAILGIQEYLRRLDGDRLATTARRSLTDRLLDLRRRTAGEGWPWFEDIVTYDNARPCQALISSGRWTGHPAALAAGLEMLDWLYALQCSPTGRFSPVGCHGFYPRGGRPAGFDQQPLEAHAMIAACIEAFHAEGRPLWLDRAWNVFEWFHGHNVLGVGLGDPRTGGCRDGLLEDRANENQGAESTLAYLGALVEMLALESAAPGQAASRRKPVPCR